jgi:DNA/RNA-binding domain of Phe-tRNA-synthetase-like protein
MATYTIQPEIFEKFPAFRRGVIVAQGIQNKDHDPETARLLNMAVSGVPPAATALEQQKIAVWNAAYAGFGTDPNKYTPSIRFLYEQIRRGKPLRSINSVVDLMNYVSVAWGIPCGGDDLDALQGGDVCLGLARGGETFSPLFKPSLVEHPDLGEVIYFIPQTGRVMCRRWTWRNSDFSKITLTTRAVVVNLDLMMPPFSDFELHQVIQGMLSLLKKYCGGTTQAHILSSANPCIELSNIAH